MYSSELNKILGEGDITFPLFSSAISIEWRNKHLIYLESYAYQNDTILCHEFTINKRYFKDFHISNGKGLL